jgi:hypothetical protein
MILDHDDQTSFIECNVKLVEIFQQIVWYRALSEMIDKQLHGRLVGELALLSVEPEVRRI